MADSSSVGSVAMALALLTHDVDAAEVLDRGVDGALHVLFLAHVADHGDALAARGLDLGDGGVHGAGQLGVRLGGLGQQHDVGAALGGAERDRQADAAAAAGDDQGAVGERLDMGLLGALPPGDASILTNGIGILILGKCHNRCVPGLQSS